MSKLEAWKIVEAWMEAWPGIADDLTYNQVLHLVNLLAERKSNRRTPR